jgi:alpha-N-arabinofuranosidase
MSYRNPVIRGFHPDPSVCRVGSDFYLVTSSFEYWPGVPVFHSTDLVNWRRIGHCLTRPEQLDLSRVEDSAGIWAPTIRWSDGVFYVITTVMDEANFTNGLDENGQRPPLQLSGRHFLVTATDPAGPWSDPVWVEGGGLDPSLLFDHDGRVLVTHAEGGVLLQSHLDVRTGERDAEERAIWSGTQELTSEGPHLYRIDELYYLMVAEGGTSYGHSISVARSRSPWGPWEDCPGNPILSHRTHDVDPIQATGHGDLFEDGQGSWWLVFLGIRSRGYPAFHNLGRETFLAPVEWVDGWPVVAERVTLEMASAPLGRQRPMPVTWRDDFTSGSLCDEWNTLRGPCPGVQPEPGRLVLRPSATGERTFVGVRQVEPSCRAEAEVELQPLQDGDEAGLTVFMNGRHHYDLGLVQVDGKQVARLRRRVGSLVSEGPATPVSGGPVRLRVEATPFTYSFWLQDGEQATLLGSGEVLYLSSEVAGGFTGVYLGLYAAGTGRADVGWFERTTTG